jgi:hypothetical protein
MEERFENKFIFTRGCKKNYNLLLVNCFLKKEYENRVVNSIYYDTSDLDNLYQNINGFPNRVKYRIRWYNEINNTEVFFEKKIKSGLVTKKQKFNLGFFKNYVSLQDFLHSKEFAKKIISFTDHYLMQVLRVSYKREYWGDFEKKLRVTFDNQILAQKIYLNKFNNRFFELDFDILELKYKIKDHEYIKNKIKQANFNLRNQKFSKYVRSFLLLSDIGLH